MPPTRRTRNNTHSKISPETVRPCRSREELRQADDAISREVASQPTGGDAAPRLPRSGRARRPTVQGRRLNCRVAPVCTHISKLARAMQSGPIIGTVSASVIPSPTECSAGFSSDALCDHACLFGCQQSTSSPLHDNLLGRYPLCGCQRPDLYCYRTTTAVLVRRRACRHFVSERAPECRAADQRYTSVEDGQRISSLRMRVQKRIPPRRGRNGAPAGLQHVDESVGI